jgi:hypothetical protein
MIGQANARNTASNTGICQVTGLEKRTCHHCTQQNEPNVFCSTTGERLNECSHCLLQASTCTKHVQRNPSEEAARRLIEALHHHNSTLPQVRKSDTDKFAQLAASRQFMGSKRLSPSKAKSKQPVLSRHAKPDVDERRVTYSLKKGYLVPNKHGNIISIRAEKELGDSVVLSYGETYGQALRKILVALKLDTTRYDPFPLYPHCTDVLFISDILTMTYALCISRQTCS